MTSILRNAIIKTVKTKEKENMKHVSQLKEVQEFAMDIIKDYPLDNQAPRVLLALASVTPAVLKQFFELNTGKTPDYIYHSLARSGSIASWLDSYALVAYIND